MKSWLWLSLLATICQCEIFHLSVNNGDRKVIDLGAFGFLGNGKSNMTIVLSAFQFVGSDGKVHVKPPAPIGFSLEERDTINTARLEQNVHYDSGTCFVDWKRPDRVSMVLPSSNWTIMDKKREVLLRSDISSESPQKIDLSTHLSAGFLALFFFNCNEGSKVSFKVEVHQFNVQGDKKDYLSLGKSNLPVVFAVFFVAYLGCLIAWIATLMRNRQFVHKIHWLMATLLVVKALSLLFEAIQYLVLQMYGTHHLSADLPYYFFITVKGIVLFVVILLIGTGWSFIKPFLTEKDKRILIIVLPLQVIVNIAMIVVDTLNEGSASWGTWRDALRILDIVCCCAILLPIVWSIRNLREANATDGKVSRNLSRLRQFRTFYILVVTYIYFTRIVVVLVRSALHYQVTWIAPVIHELGTLGFYAFSGMKFRPMNENPYLHMDDDDDTKEMEEGNL